jgi:superfamily II DNA or RNA helicase/F0F1-type ATP synthase membrane subunit b/b'
LTPYNSQYVAWQLSRRRSGGGQSADLLASTLVDAQVDLNPHQVEGALFAFRNPLSKGVILADEVGLGKTIEAGLVIAQRWAERRRHILIVVPANLRKQWHQELLEKFGIEALILDSDSHKGQRAQGNPQPFFQTARPVICSYQFAQRKADELQRVRWDLAVLDEAHRLRNAWRPNNVIGRTLKAALGSVQKVLLTATPLQNSLLELYGLVSLVDERVFGDLASFRDQFGNLNQAETFARLRSRLQNVCTRTLRRQVQPYVSYTRRIPLVETFTPSQDEQALRELVAEYLRRPSLNALPAGQRQLISLVLWKLLASSSFAIAGALGTMLERLEAQLADQGGDPSGRNDGHDREGLVARLDQDYEALDETAEEWSEPEPAQDRDQDQALLDEVTRHGLAAEVAELQAFRHLALNIRDNVKGGTLLQALAKAFEQTARLGAQPKALIFTESRRTQDYLLDLLEREGSPYAGQVVLFNGTNTGPQAQRIYRDWLARHAGTDRITGSKTSDMRAALVEHFRDHARIMIATEAGAEGINLQFCSLVINYDLPWNPQRVEQRIGRCHRYGQKHDVVVVNFVDLSNPADRRVYELLAVKFQLFEGVFGVSDEVLGTISSGVDFERRIAEIYQSCRTPEEIETSFRQLQSDLAAEISDSMIKTRQLLLENFDEAVQERLRLRAVESQQARDRHEQWLMQLTRAELGDAARFDVQGDSFALRQPPAGLSPEEAPAGRYELPRHGSGEAHVYRVGHPLAQHLIARARDRVLPVARLVLDYEAYGRKVSTLEPLRGAQGWLALSVLTIASMGAAEDILLLAATDADGRPLPDEDAEKLLRLPARGVEEGSDATAQVPSLLALALERQQQARVEEVNQRNLSHFDTEVQKLDAWADDLKNSLEQEVREIDREIKEVRRTASVAATLDEKLSRQKRQKELEGKRNQLRRRIFDRQDEIDTQRGRLIDDLEGKMKQSASSVPIFAIAWELK